MNNGPRRWEVGIEKDDGKYFAVLRERGKRDYKIEVTRDQMTWINALRDCIDEAD